MGTNSTVSTDEGSTYLPCTRFPLLSGADDVKQININAPACGSHLGEWMEPQPPQHIGGYVKALQLSWPAVQVGGRIFSLLEQLSDLPGIPFEIVLKAA